MSTHYSTVLRSCSLGFLLLMGIASYSQSKEEQHLRALEQREARAILNKDTSALINELWAPELIVNNPANIVVSKPQVIELLKSGKIDYEAFERIIEEISILGNTAIVMGREELKPQGLTDNEGKNLVRRFTNVWLKRQGVWKLIARQATISSIQ